MCLFTQYEIRQFHADVRDGKKKVYQQRRENGYELIRLVRQTLKKEDVNIEYTREFGYEPMTSSSTLKLFTKEYRLLFFDNTLYIVKCQPYNAMNLTGHVDSKTHWQLFSIIKKHMESVQKQRAQKEFQNVLQSAGKSK
jgi:hypothetical protein